MLTGESLPVEKEPGDEVTGGTLNRTGAITVRATRVGRETVLAQIVRLVRRRRGRRRPSSASRTGSPRSSSRSCSPWRRPTFALWWWLGPGLAAALVAAVAVLVVACPCALGLATPTAIVVGAGRGAGMGVLFRSGEALERASAVEVVLLDKTGTLTAGKPSVTDIVPAKGS